ncbi:hypothetical protein AXF42_Ash016721 [Apostasia shenzhenica]|uniref:Uncharacterized protein n=1 Tax=Apostasia shenzhenica TaxID=1088818 RepID=A0A2I0AQ69_9ASPA|nr:hypothetical protein AXF42_Ash016721 [Apostasia shenzhenica]
MTAIAGIAMLLSATSPSIHDYRAKSPKLKAGEEGKITVKESDEASGGAAKDGGGETGDPAAACTGEEGNKGLQK